MGRRGAGAETELAWVALYNGGMTAQEIATTYGVGVTPVYRALRRRGAVMRSPGRRADHPRPPVEPLTEAEAENVLAMRRGGEAMTRIALALGLPYNLVAKLCRENGIGGRR